MINIIRGSIILILAGLLRLLSSCTPESCYEDTESFMKASFYKNEAATLQAPDSITLYGLNMEASRIYDKALKIQPALIPLNVTTDSSVFIIKINGITDTAMFLYSSYPHLISKECGYTFYHNLNSTSFTKNIIDSIVISKSNITTINEENIRIFY